jgi:hypothetical protein
LTVRCGVEDSGEIAAPLPRRTFLAARQRHLNRRLAPGPP